ncbi:hypothetical protein [Lawsonibacter faecis]|uniref:Uncharacterized protein n=1 Tax=Lawsonibacter faecis TaxID=2763052 RepID=A0A8J6MGW5_9FIRM|nr:MULTISPECIES: hypothetical protein [Oscillospiraceae]MTQ98321.1 hypothetical protein [Pseudoflavonifractor sp. BIOML-A16]MTR07695.1 hypothetical protein [Pseudoflavonifractor sp. BIOML-A15]MTR33846.1 hypothetical protein [Pseudoflavonifractor sp. BIOML-A14]MTR73905.1 hypothetical protein [Pseudoflavonifractor sp. BIOML-A18]MTS64706.1 hypothetical protein [Pseudoflavonifractor sp. BIOML-A5]MTS72499.1 hypothetical protein [Pseudoflavonifractor sp. BIOML-A8]MTS92184.1 hypothetical protein [P
MVEESKRTLAYICPSCRQAVIAERSVFQLAASANAIPCPCGKSALRVEMMGDRVKLTVPCLFCESDHTVACSSKAFLHEKTLAFACAASGLDCCYAGEEAPVFAAMKRLEEAVDKLERDAGEKGAFLDELVMHEVLSELKEIAQRDGISCACGSRKWKLQVNYSSIDLFCADCGAAMRIPAATASDIDDICCRNTMVIHGK